MVSEMSCQTDNLMKKDEEKKMDPFGVENQSSRPALR